MPFIYQWRNVRRNIREAGSTKGARHPQFQLPKGFLMFMRGCMWGMVQYHLWGLCVERDETPQNGSPSFLIHLPHWYDPDPTSSKKTLFMAISGVCQHHCRVTESSLWVGRRGNPAYTQLTELSLLFGDSPCNLVHRSSLKKIIACSVLRRLVIRKWVCHLLVAISWG